MYTAVVMIEKHLQNQLQRYSAKQDRESVTPEHTPERYFEKKIVYTSVYRKITKKHSGTHFNGASEQKE